MRFLTSNDIVIGVQTITVIGNGRVGIALAIALQRAGLSIEEIVFRNTEPNVDLKATFGHRTKWLKWSEYAGSSSDVLLITTQDSEIRGVVDAMTDWASFPKVILHTSGALSSEILSGAREYESSIGSLHPITAISDPVSGSDRLSDSYFCVEGDTLALSTAHKLVSLVGGNSFSIGSEHKALYHAAAVTAAGHVIALFDTAIEMLELCDLDNITSKKILLPLVQSGIANLVTVDPANALTGPYKRGDLATVDLHLRALEAKVPQLIERIYLDLAERSAEMMLAAAPENEKYKAIAKKIRIANKNAV